MEEWLSKLIKRDSIAMVLYARFPSEMAYSHHIIQVAKGFVENNCDVNIYYPKTYNKKTLKETPEEYYGNLTNIRFIQINNVDITSFKIYEISPNFVKSPRVAIVQNSINADPTPLLHTPRVGDENEAIWF